jgi:hypothetical protein
VSNSEADEEEEEGEGIDSDVSDEYFLMFYEIRQAIILLNKKTDKINNVARELKDLQKRILAGQSASHQ